MDKITGREDHAGRNEGASLNNYLYFFIDD